MNLLYHRVNSWQPDPWTLCVSPAHFAQQMEVISRLNPRPVVTFDDGYADNLHHALPVLEQYEVSARIFIIAGAVGSKTEMWWDALERVFCDGDSTDMAGYAKAFNCIRPLSSSQQAKEIDKLLRAKCLPATARPERRMLTSEELCLLAASPLVQIGAHTVSHPVLSVLPPADQYHEISDGKRRVEEMLCRRIDSFSYPNGMDSDYTPDTIEAVRCTGFLHAYSAFEHRRDDPYQLPRVMIRDWNGEDFAGQLSQAASRAGTTLSGL